MRAENVEEDRGTATASPKNVNSWVQLITFPPGALLNLFLVSQRRHVLYPLLHCICRKLRNVSV